MWVFFCRKVFTMSFFSRKREKSESPEELQSLKSGPEALSPTSGDDGKIKLKAEMSLLVQDLSFSSLLCSTLTTCLCGGILEWLHSHCWLHYWFGNICLANWSLGIHRIRQPFSYYLVRII